MGYVSRAQIQARLDVMARPSAVIDLTESGDEEEPNPAKRRETVWFASVYDDDPFKRGDPVDAAVKVEEDNDPLLALATAAAAASTLPVAAVKVEVVKVEEDQAGPARVTLPAAAPGRAPPVVVKVEEVEEVVMPRIILPNAPRSGSWMESFTEPAPARVHAVPHILLGDLPTFNEGSDFTFTSETESHSSYTIDQGILEDGKPVTCIGVPDRGAQAREGLDTLAQEGVCVPVHPNLRQPLGLVNIENEFYGLAVQQLKGAKTLTATLFPRKGSPPSLAVRAKLALGIAEGVAALAGVRQSHGALCPDNVLVTEEMVPVLINFAFERVLYGTNPRGDRERNPGLSLYMDPRVFEKRTMDIGEQMDCDLYSLGKIIALVFGGKPMPATRDEFNAFAGQIEDGRVRDIALSCTSKMRPRLSEMIGSLRRVARSAESM